jgi:hypothetical protein
VLQYLQPQCHKYVLSLDFQIELYNKNLFVVVQTVKKHLTFIFLTATNFLQSLLAQFFIANSGLCYYLLAWCRSCVCSLGPHHKKIPLPAPSILLCVDPLLGNRFRDDGGDVAMYVYVYVKHHVLNFCVTI